MSRQLFWYTYYVFLRDSSNAVCCCSLETSKACKIHITKQNTQKCIFEKYLGVPFRIGHAKFLKIPKLLRHTAFEVSGKNTELFAVAFKSMKLLSEMMCALLCSKQFQCV